MSGVSSKSCVTVCGVICGGIWGVIGVVCGVPATCRSLLHHVSSRKTTHRGFVGCEGLSSVGSRPRVSARGRSAPEGTLPPQEKRLRKYADVAAIHRQRTPLGFPWQVVGPSDARHV